MYALANISAISSRAVLRTAHCRVAPGVKTVGVPARNVCRQVYKDTTSDRQLYKDTTSETQAYQAAASDEASEKLNEAVNNISASIKENWEKTEDKPAAVLITLSAVLALITLNGVVDAVDKIPIVSGVIELVGIVVTGAFTYRYLVFGPDREELVNNIKSFLKKVYGK
eukprot:jgi/Chrzof1/8151/UNPLg00198.t1